MKSFTITGEWHGSRIDRFVRVSFPGTPFAVVQILLRKGLIYLNGEKASGNVRLKAGDVVAIDIAEADENGAAAAAPPRTPRGTRGIERRARRPLKGASEQAPRAPHALAGTALSIVYEDAALLVIDKPAGLVVHPGNRKEKGSLIDLLEEHRVRKQSSNGQTAGNEETRARETAPPEHPPFRFTPVHRLDRETSGVLVVAKTRAAARALSRLIAGGMVRRTYLAIVEGVPSPQRGEIATALLTTKGRRSRSEPSPEGKEARTSYSLLKTLPGPRALLELSLGTGRTHQIRAHLASIGHPVVGDGRYGASALPSGRILLHAWKIRFPHPDSGVMVEAAAAPPKEFELA